MFTALYFRPEQYQNTTHHKIFFKFKKNPLKIIINYDKIQSAKLNMPETRKDIQK